MKKQQKHLDFYNQCMETGYLPLVDFGKLTGLCGCADRKQISKKKLALFEPTIADDSELCRGNFSTGWWGYDVKYSDTRFNIKDRESKFTPLRQTIILFIAAMNGELN